MKLFSILISLSMAFGSFAIAKTAAKSAAKTAAKAEEKRKPAETHGGVIRNNAEFRAVLQLALGEAGSLLRIHSIRKVTDCRTTAGESLYVVNYGGQDSATGVESTDSKGETYVAKDFEWENQTAKVEIYKGNDCNSDKNK